MANNPYLEGNCAPVHEEITATDLTVVGTLPAELDGRWLRNGPNPLGEVADPATHHWFSGEGMVHGVRLRDGKAEWYRNRFVRSDEVNSKLGDPPFEGPRFNEWDFSPNTSVGSWAGRTYAVVEAGGNPVELSYELDSICRSDFDGTLQGPFTAHPKYDPVNNELHAVCYSWPDLVDRVHYLVIGADGLVRKTVEIPVDDMPMIHDMALTTRYAIVLDLSVTVDFEAAMAGRFPFAWNDSHSSRVGLLPRDGDADDIIWCDVPQCYVFHPLNAYDDADGNVVIDVCKYERLFDADRRGPFGDGGARLERWTINPGARTVRQDVVDGRQHEFPIVRGSVGTQQHAFGYTAGFADGLAGPTHKIDFASGEVATFDHGPGRFGSEPLFIARGDAEDDGWLMLQVHDAETNSGELCVIDAQDLAAGPVAAIKLPQRVPYGFHGAWIPG